MTKKSKIVPVNVPKPTRDVDWRVKDGYKPTRFFEVGERVRYGNHDKCEVLEVQEDGALYQVRCFGSKEVYGIAKDYEEFQCVNWYQLFKMVEGVTNFTVPQAFRMVQSNRMLDGLLSMVLSGYSGVDFSPEYQRDYVWTNEDKELLIDSIFKNVTIGLFVFATRPFQDDAKHHEIIDGKQRLSALVDFYEDRFTYKGRYFSELGNGDIQHFENYGVVVGVLEKPSEKEKLAAFIAVNTFGKVMDKDHLKKVQERYETL